LLFTEKVKYPAVTTAAPVLHLALAMAVTIVGSSGNGVIQLLLLRDAFTIEEFVPSIWNRNNLLQKK
jgi:hypothetical protein